MEMLEIVIWPITVLIVSLIAILIFRRKLRKAYFNLEKKELSLDLSGNYDQGPKLVTKKNLNELKSLDKEDILRNSELLENKDKSRYFKFSDYLERYVIEKNGKRIRNLRFRLGVQQRGLKILNINLKGYLIVTNIIRNPNDNVGWGSNWPELKLDKDYLPAVTDYWSVDHEIDVPNSTSPFKELNNSKDVIKMTIKIYATGFLESGKKVFGSQQYELDESTCIYGKFKLRDLGENTISSDSFNTIIPIEEEGDWSFIREVSVSESNN
ncbi:hypothetical protein [Marinifilum caeruleilacunae]|uniref:Uncharacterized protein n=1 Tax=Marinifilum caeruleilacunae TaxID=2499076 RepID=A0ABX1WWV1_9BACT|nr:hypothetical protein [Marinifilum caeruleilacunae]NOU60595.1 hypothetical protein [Marinifilum caeruleilacunae]